MKLQLPKSYYNLISYIGTAIAAISLFMILYLFVVSIIYTQSSSYLGLFIYIILPVFLVIGLLLIPIGMIRARKRNKEKIIKKAWPVIDLNITKYRNAIVIFSIGSLFFLFLTGIGSYEAFHYTESVEFCGTLCHEVMEPEYTAYQNSSHSRVGCVDCHVGSGADWYVRSKLSGVRQVYAVLTNDFHRPIETPIENLRPARETCEECHWPQKFYERQLRYSKHYLTDENNTEWNIGLEMKIGPSYSAFGQSEGIHWHINPDVRIEYIANDKKREEIPWVRYSNKVTGQIIDYLNPDFDLTNDEIEKSKKRTMDCMDCHNRPSHHYLSPQEFVDIAMASGDIPKDLTEIKLAAMGIFSESFSTQDSMLSYIETYIFDYYDGVLEENKSNTDKINKAIAGIQKGASTYIFPEMKASWDVYPNHIGHKTFNGCFRCHNGTHTSKTGKVISNDCNICHSIMKQGKAGEENFAMVNQSLEFLHPVDIDQEWKSSLCSDCHRYLY